MGVDYMHKERLEVLQQGVKKSNKKYVLYWMQQSQRVHYNHALNHAIHVANLYDLEVLVCFFIDDGFSNANERHFSFLLEGLSEVKNTLETFKIGFHYEICTAKEGIKPLIEDAFYVVFDKGYQKYQLEIREHVKQVINHQAPDLMIVEIDSDMVMPIKSISNKLEYGAYTIRPKLMKLYPSYLDYKRIYEVNKPFSYTDVYKKQPFEIESILQSLSIDRSIKRSPIYKGGYVEAQKWWFRFMTNGMNRYHESNDPSENRTSKMSMYLHFGQISVLELIDKLNMLLNENKIDQAPYDAYIEQLVVRRTLAFNYVTFNQGYDSFEQMTEPWAYETMKNHEQDPREFLYTKEQLQLGLTHDPYFNAAMAEMRITGYMHNYMRMYWAKKIIEWMPTYKEAYQTILELNNSYFIDGRDPNSYAGVAWCFGKHDRAWTERFVFGKLRYMNASGLTRKFEIETYVLQMNELMNQYETSKAG